MANAKGATTYSFTVCKKTSKFYSQYGAITSHHGNAKTQWS